MVYNNFQQYEGWVSVLMRLNPQYTYSLIFIAKSVEINRFGHNLVRFCYKSSFGGGKCYNNYRNII